MPNLYGSIVTGKDVMLAVKGTLQLWMPDYLAELAVRSGRSRGQLQKFRSYVEEIDIDKFAEDQVPACIISVPGLVGEPEDHSGKLHAAWRVGVGAVVLGNSRENTYELSCLYIAAIRVCLLQQRSLGGFASGVRWTGESYEPLAQRDVKTLGAGVAEFAIRVADTADRKAGPRGEPLDPMQDPDPLKEIREVEFSIGGMNG